MKLIITAANNTMIINDIRRIAHLGILGIFILRIIKGILLYLLHTVEICYKKSIIEK